VSPPQIVRRDLTSGGGSGGLLGTFMPLDHMPLAQILPFALRRQE
jgi:hypothetical protein